MDRVWGWVLKNPKPKTQNPTESDKFRRVLHKLIKKVTEDVENFSFNTAIAAFMEFLNLIKDEPVSAASIKTFLILLYPFAPHICEELNQTVTPRLHSGSSSKSANQRSLQQEKWPEFDPALVIDATTELVVQVNGKVKGRLTINRGADQKSVEAEALKLETVGRSLAGQSVKRVVFVQNRLINFVV